MSLSETLQACSNLGVAVVAAGALIYIHVRQIPAMIQALKEEGAENRRVHKEEGQNHRAALHEIVSENKRALDDLSSAFRSTLAEDRGRCDEREKRSQEQRHQLASKVGSSVEHHAAVVALMGEVKQLTETLKQS